MAQTDLGKWMITNGGNYNPETTYEQLTIVLYNNNMFLTLRTVKGITPVNDNIHYNLMAQGTATTLLSAINATDTYGVLGEVGTQVSSQALVDYLADSVMNKLIAKTQIANDLVTQDSAKVLSALQGYNLKQSVDELNSNLTSAELHRMIFRGKNLGGSLTVAQKAAIQNGTFEDLWLGDYWVINDITWRIVDFDYWLHCGDALFEKHHLVIMPDTGLYNAVMNDSNVTTGGYVGSKMYTSNLANAKTIVNAAFQGSVLTHREYLCNAVANGKQSGGTWFDSSIELPSEIMMYGHIHFGGTSDGNTIPNIYTNSKTQLALFMVCPRFITGRSHAQRLRDVVSSDCFAAVGSLGSTGYNYASDSLGVRPVFPVG